MGWGGEYDEWKTTDEAEPVCPTCGESRCTDAHDCAGCQGEAVRGCDRDHPTCDGCAYQVGGGVAGSDVRDRCARCDEEDEERYDEAAEAVHD